MMQMYSHDPDSRPNFRELKSAIQRLITTEHSTSGYSYTTTQSEHKECEPSVRRKVSVFATASHLGRQLSTDSGPYADSAELVELYFYN